MALKKAPRKVEKELRKMCKDRREFIVVNNLCKKLENGLENEDDEKDDADSDSKSYTKDDEDQDQDEEDLDGDEEDVDDPGAFDLSYSDEDGYKDSDGKDDL